MRKIVLLVLFTVSLFAHSYGKLYFFGNCISCHGELGKRSAPHLAEVKGYYLIKYPKKEDFVENLAKWVYKPDAKTALLPEAIEEYNIMPHLAIDIDTLREIAKYIYEYNEFTH